MESVAFRGDQIDVWTEDGAKPSFDRRYYMILQQPGTVFDAEWEGRNITGLRINGRWAFHTTL